MNRFFNGTAHLALCVAICLLILSGLAVPTSSALADGGGPGFGCACSHCSASPTYCPDKTPPLCMGGSCNTPDQNCQNSGFTCSCSCGTGGGTTCICF